ncbi:hypothetical protein KIL84_009881 [Mauremys mutica]|uniref:Ig-like domain-containing protein n=1 Tax=Mauremys mutica TaxID=74926 RepID=A0A9D4AZA8_9SAUR|nr:hypothetical protein KIL84_009881 [Mauremys mutica]
MLKTLVSTLVLILVSSGAVDAKVSQPAALTLLAGGRADLPCNHSVAAYDRVIWYYQSPGAAPRAVISGYKSADTSGWFELSIDPSRRSAPLRITKVAVEDSGVYYCALRDTARGANGNSVTQTESSVTLCEGEPVLLNCTYQTTGYPTLFWYVQYGSQAPRLFLRDGSADPEEERTCANPMTEPERIIMIHEGKPVLLHCTYNSSVVQSLFCALHKEVFMWYCYIEKGCICLSEVTQSPDQSRAELTDAKIQCTHDIPAGNYDSIYWYYRKASTELTYIAHSYSGERNSGRFRVYVDRANSSSVLTIGTLQPGDGAVYYCALQRTMLRLL